MRLVVCILLQDMYRPGLQTGPIGIGCKVPVTVKEPCRIEPIVSKGSARAEITESNGKRARIVEREEREREKKGKAALILRCGES